MLIVYLTRHMIQAVVGEEGKIPVVNQVCQMLLPEGLFHAGIVSDEEQLKRILSEFWTENRLPQTMEFLVLDSSHMSNKSLEAPILSSIDMMEFLPREFDDINRAKEPLYAYWTAKEDKVHKKQRIFATMAERSYVKQYRDLFESIGVRVQEICSPMTGVLALLGSINSLKTQSAVVQIWNGSRLTNILILRGEYLYSNVTQMLQKPGTPGFSVEVARQVSRLGQFMKAQQMEETITHVYLSGIDAEDFSYCAEGIYQVSEKILTVELEEQVIGSLVECSERIARELSVFPIGAFFLGEGYIGLCQQLAMDPEKIRQRRDIKRRLRPVGVVAGILMAMAAALGGRYLYLNQQLTQLKNDNTDPQIVAAVAEFDDLEKKNRRIKERLDELDTDTAAINSYPVPNTEVIDVIESCADSWVDIEVQSYEAESGEIQVSATVAKVDQINVLIEDLRGHNIFHEVTYHGYRYDDALQKWIVSVTCTLSQRAGKERGAT